MMKSCTECNGSLSVIFLILLALSATYIFNQYSRDMEPISTRSLRSLSVSDPVTVVQKVYQSIDFSQTYCSKTRGSSGKWIRLEQKENEYRDSYGWQDDFCETKVMNLENFCSTLEQLKMTRVFFVGDSLAFQQFESMLNLLGLRHNDFKEARSLDENDIRSGVVQCPNSSSNFSFKLLFFRNDVISLTKVDNQCDHTECHKCQCRSWINDYISSSERTLLIANLGPHCKKNVVFESNFNRFVNTMNNAAENRHLDDLFVFRTTAPGHANCREDSLPFRDEEEYNQSDQQNPFMWEKFKEYNEHAKNILLNDENEKNQRWHLLDIYPMTILRQDGHRRPPADCLHYNLPGAIDWWNHLLYSNLVDIASSVESVIS